MIRFTLGEHFLQGEDSPKRQGGLFPLEYFSVVFEAVAVLVHGHAHVVLLVQVFKLGGDRLDLVRRRLLQDGHVKQSFWNDWGRHKLNRQVVSFNQLPQQIEGVCVEASHQHVNAACNIGTVILEAWS